MPDERPMSEARARIMKQFRFLVGLDTVLEIVRQQGGAVGIDSRGELVFSDVPELWRRRIEEQRQEFTAFILARGRLAMSPEDLDCPLFPS